MWFFLSLGWIPGCAIAGSFEIYIISSLRTSQVVVVIKNPPANVGDMKGGFDLWLGKIPWRRAWQSIPVLLPGESHGQRSLVGYSSVQALSHVWLFVTPWTEAHQAFLSIADSWSLFKLMSIKLVMPSNHLLLWRPLLLPPLNFPSIRVFSNESVLRIRWPKYWASALASVLPMKIQDWFPLGFTGWISLQSKGLSRIFSKITVQRHQFFGAHLSLCPTLTSIFDYWKNHSFD